MVAYRIDCSAPDGSYLSQGAMERRVDAKFEREVWRS